MKNEKTILVINGASSSEKSPNFISIVHKDDHYSILYEKKSFERGGPERFPLYFQEFIQKGQVIADQIDFISILVGPGSFTGLRASIAFALGLQTGLNCPIVALRRGEAIFPFLEKQYPEKLIWHISTARKNRVYIETNQSTKVQAFDIPNIPWPEVEFVMSGEAVSMVKPYIPPVISWIQASLLENNALMLAELANNYMNNHKNTNKLYPLYIDPPKASLPAKGLRMMPS